MAFFPRPVTMMMFSIPEAIASSITYWITGLSTSGSISLGCALVAGRKRVPSPAAGKTALRTLEGIARHRSRTPDALQRGRYNGARGHMLDPGFVKENLPVVRAGLGNRGLDPDKILEELSTLETVRRQVIPELEGLKRQQNTSGDEIARAKRRGVDTTPVQDANRVRAQQIKQLGVRLDAIEHQRTQALL